MNKEKIKRKLIKRYNKGGKKQGEGREGKE